MSLRTQEDAVRCAFGWDSLTESERRVADLRRTRAFEQGDRRTAVHVAPDGRFAPLPHLSETRSAVTSRTRLPRHRAIPFYDRIERVRPQLGDARSSAAWRRSRGGGPRAAYRARRGPQASRRRRAGARRGLPRVLRPAGPGRRFGRMVRNLPDGRVEAVFEGSPASASATAAVAWCEHGPAFAHVHRVRVVDEHPRGETVFLVT